jgi:hypothetical protein
MFLTDDELTALTGYKQRAARVRELDRHHITYKLDAHGRILVSRAHVERVFDGAANDDKIAVPDFSGRRHGRQKASA